MRRLLASLVLASTLGFGGLTLAAPQAGAHEGHDEGAVAVCNWENFAAYGHDGFNWRWIGCNHTLHTGPPEDPGVYHSQWRNGLGTEGHTVRRYRQEAAAYRAWTRCGC